MKSSCLIKSNLNKEHFGVKSVQFSLIQSAGEFINYNYLCINVYLSTICGVINEKEELTLAALRR